MDQIEVDKRITNLVEQCVVNGHRSLFFILAEKAQKQVVVLNHLLTRLRADPSLSVLWCYKKELTLKLNKKKKLRILKRKYEAGNFSLGNDDDSLLDYFVLSSNIYWCHYGDVDKVLGRTFSIAVLQEFECLTPNIIARVVETVEGGGMIIFLLPHITSLQELVSLKMDVHSHYITEGFPSVVPHFNKRLVFSLSSCKNCLILDNHLKIVPHPHITPEAHPAGPLEEAELQQEIHDQYKKAKKSKKHLKKLKRNFESEPLSKIISLCNTLDQANALLQFIDYLSEEKNLIVSLTSARGRGKSATLGLAACVGLIKNYYNIYIMAPHPENTETVFEFLTQALDFFDYKEGTDYKVIWSSHSNNQQLVSGVEVLKHRRQVVKYFSPLEFHSSNFADLVIIDEAAAIPLPIVKSWLNASKIFMASTVNGYEGTGRSLSLKLIAQLRTQSVDTKNDGSSTSFLQSHTLYEVKLNEAIRYHNGDSVETWMNDLFCLDESKDFPCNYFANPEFCDLYYVNKSLLCSYLKLPEMYLQALVKIFATSHYKNSPNDLFMLADAPAHHIFCLMNKDYAEMELPPQIYCVIQVAFEGKISRENVIQETLRGKRTSGDLIPWLISQQFQDDCFPSHASARIVRIATHPNCQKMGYGIRAIQLLTRFFENEYDDKEEHALTMQNLYQERKSCDSKLPLFFKLNEIKSEPLEYIGVSYGLTKELLRFWKKANFIPLYLRQTVNVITGEHTCIMVKVLKSSSCKLLLKDFWCDFCERFVNLLPSAFKNLSADVAVNIIHSNEVKLAKRKAELNQFTSSFSSRDIQRLEKYCQQLVDYHLVMDLMPKLSNFLFLGYITNFSLPNIGRKLLLAMGLQNKSVETTAVELDLDPSKVMGILTTILKKFHHKLLHLKKNIEEKKPYIYVERNTDLFSPAKSNALEVDTQQSCIRKSKKQKNSASINSEEKRKKLKM